MLKVSRSRSNDFLPTISQGGASIPPLITNVHSFDQVRTEVLDSIADHPARSRFYYRTLSELVCGLAGITTIAYTLRCFSKETREKRAEKQGQKMQKEMH